MKTANVSYPEFLSKVTSKGLEPQFTEDGSSYYLFAIEAGVISWETIVAKGSSDALDFEQLHKASCNLPLEVKAGPGRPIRVAPSPQPINTVQHWKGTKLTLPAGEVEAHIDVSFPSLAYIKGAKMYCLDPNCDGNTWIDLDVVFTAYDMVVVPKLIEGVFLLPGQTVSFESPEAMALAPEFVMRCYIRRSVAEQADHVVNVIIEYFS